MINLVDLAGSEKAHMNQDVPNMSILFVVREAWCCVTPFVTPCDIWFEDV